MTKNSMPAKGFPIDSHLKEIKEGIFEGDLEGSSTMTRSTADAMALVDTLRAALNVDACMNESQRETLVKFILHDPRKLPELQTALIPVVNSFRHECAVCLNETCGMRDPGSSFKEARKKADPTYRGIGEFEGVSMWSYNRLHNSGISLALRSLAKTGDRVKAILENNPKRIQEVETILVRYGLSLNQGENSVDSHSQQTDDQTDDGEHGA